MDIDASGSQTVKLRKESLGMLLSEHRAECEAPCRLVCPLGLNIPLLNRYISEGKPGDAGEMAFREMGLPSTACRLCPGYCENACRRKMIDHNIAISSLVHFSSTAMQAGKSLRQNATGKSVAIAGGGASGLITAFNLLLDGHSVDIFEKEPYAGGSLIEEIGKKGLHQDIAKVEIERLLETGIKIRFGINVDNEFINNSLVDNYDAVIIANSHTGLISEVAENGKFIRFEGDTRTLRGRHLFLTGSAAKADQPIIRRMSQAKLTAASVSRFLLTGEISGAKKRFNSTIGKIGDEEKSEWLRECPEKITRVVEPVNAKESAVEAENCLHCDCRASSECSLRELCDSMEVKNPSAKFTGHPISKKIDYQNRVIFEHAKCIKCGLCVRITDYKTNDPSLCFTGRGFMTMISEPLSYGFEEITGKNIDKAIYICPTGALTWKE
ncbi:MAG: hypothetical protein E4G95_08955 [Bacteroidia bacterium]|nr:MAG: hypothetical protein E4G95_08955 [Bacteroidia bacterium]